MANEWFISDTHFSHAFVAGLRQGIAREDVTQKDISEHDERIIRAWNRVVQPEDIVWHLGDLAVIPVRRVAHLVERLAGRKRLILGNHDQAHPMFGSKSFDQFDDTLAAGFEWVGPFAHTGLDLGGQRHTRVALSHFPYRADREEGADPREMQWRLRDEGNLLIHGHLHSAEAMTSDREVHVGWDTWGRPVSRHEVAELFRAAH